MSDWVGFSYRDYYDMPRMLVFRYRHLWFMLDSAFDVASDEYRDVYEVFVMEDFREEWLAGSWEALQGMGARRIGTVSVGDVRFDVTHRKYVDVTSIPPVVAAAGDPA